MIPATLAPFVLDEARLEVDESFALNEGCFGRVAAPQRDTTHCSASASSRVCHHQRRRHSQQHVLAKTRAEVTPMKPKNGAEDGHMVFAFDMAEGRGSAEVTLRIRISCRPPGG